MEKIKTIILPHLGDSEIQILKQGNEVWIHLRLFSQNETKQVAANTKIINREELGIPFLKIQTHTIFTYEANSKIKTDISISHMGIVILNDTSITGTSQWGFFRIN